MTTTFLSHWNRSHYQNKTLSEVYRRVAALERNRTGEWVERHFNFFIMIHYPDCLASLL